MKYKNVDELMADETVPLGTRRALALREILHPHFVAIRYEFFKDGKSVVYLASAFLLSVSDEWFLVTAGHCEEDINSLTLNGFRLATVNLIDGFGLNPKHNSMIPFDYEDAAPTNMTELGFDSLVLRVSAMHRRLLEANGKRPLTEEVWQHQPANVDVYILMGVPHDRTDDKGSFTRFDLVPYWVDPTERDDPFAEMLIPMFYGKIAWDDTIYGDLKGVSGGPIFGFSKVGDKTKYWLIAMQSGWNRADRRIAGPKTQALGYYIQVALEKLGAVEMRNSRQCAAGQSEVAG